MAAIRYAQVMFDVGILKESIEEAEKAFQDVPELKEILQNPIVTKEEKRRTIDRIFSEDIRSFLKVVTDCGKMEYIEDIFRAYATRSNEMAGIVTAQLTYVEAPDKEKITQMEQFICREFRANGVRWDMRRRSELIGGFVLSVNGREYDYSVQGRLTRLEHKLTWR